MTDTRVLTESAVTGDRQAFGELYEHYRGFVHGYIRKRVDNPQAAEDLTQDVFVRALASIGSWTYQGRDIGAWLVTIARNLIHDQRKMSARRRTIPVDHSTYAYDGPDTDRRVDPVTVAVLNDTTTVLDAAIAALSPQQRRVLALRFGEDLSLEETAQVMGLRVGAVKGTQYRATQTLRQALTPAAVR